MQHRQKLESLGVSAGGIAHDFNNMLSASSGQEGINIVADFDRAVTLVILDMTMPGMGGIETMFQMRTLVLEIPVVLTSGYSEQHAALPRGKDAPSAFLQKPYDMVQLNTVLSRVLSGTYSKKSLSYVCHP